MPQEGVLGRAQADAAQVLVVQPAYRPNRLAEGAAKAGVAAGLCRPLLILNVYTGSWQLSRGEGFGGQRHVAGAGKTRYRFLLLTWLGPLVPWAT